MIQSICPSCGNEKAFTDDKNGKKYKCPNCGEIITIESIGASIYNEHAANVTSAYSASISQAEIERKRAENKDEYEKLLKKSKRWKNWGIVFGVFAFISLWWVLTGAKDSNWFPLLFWGGLCGWFEARADKLKKQANSLWDIDSLEEINNSSNLDSKILSLYQKGKKLEAVKLYKDATGKSLTESKEYVDKLTT